MGWHGSIVVFFFARLHYSCIDAFMLIHDLAFFFFRVFFSVFFFLLAGAEGCAPGGDGNDGAFSRSLSRPAGHPRVHRAVRRGQRLLVQTDG